MSETAYEFAALASGADLADRYVRAAGRTGPKWAPHLPGVAVEGYWLNDWLFFHVNEARDAASGVVVPVARVADLQRWEIEDALRPEALAQMLSALLARDVLVTDLAAVEFDMPDPRTLAVMFEGDWYLYDRGRGSMRATDIKNGANALYSPDGRFLCRLEGNNVALIERSCGACHAITVDGTRHNAYARDSETALAGVAARIRPAPVGLWSADSRWFLTHQIDERELPDATLLQYVPPEGGKPVLHQLRYPVPGDPVPTATIVAIDRETSAVVRFDEARLPLMAFSPFTARRIWFGDANTAWLLRVDRYSRQIELIALELEKGESRIVLSEIASEGYLDLNPVITGTPNIRVVRSTGEVIWYSEREGWGHLTLHDASTGDMKNGITRGDWLVRDIVHVEADTRKIYLLTNGLHAGAERARRSLCVVGFDGTGFAELARHDGDLHVAVTEPSGFSNNRPYRPANAAPGLSNGGRYACVRTTSIDCGETVVVRDLESTAVLSLGALLPVVGESTPQPFTVLAADGTTPLSGVMFYPSDFCAGERYPLVDYIYPGPQAPHRPQHFNSVRSAFARALAELGMITIMLDTRGNPPGSRAFHQAGQGSLLEPQLADHAAAITQLRLRHAFIDPIRAGIVGQSAGGAAAARALFDYSQIFQVGVAVCGNHDSDQYAAIWSDKYRGPRPAGGRADRIDLTAVNRLRGRLLLISGDMDENVLLGQTLGLVDLLIAANKNFDLLVVPNAGHDIMMTNGYVQRRIWDYFVQYLLGTAPPSEFALSFSTDEIRSYFKKALRELQQ